MLRQINIPNVRWPGGCFADYYHWRDGIGPHAERPTIVNTIWGGTTEDNSFGTHEFMGLIDRLGTEPIIVGNVGSGTVEEMADLDPGQARTVQASVRGEDVSAVEGRILTAAAMQTHNTFEQPQAADSPPNRFSIHHSS